MNALPSGTRIGDFVIESLLGRGGMGTVYQAVPLRLDRPVALKLVATGLADDPKFAERFLREATIMRDLEHPSVVPVYDAGSDDGRLYLAMRLLEKRTLHDLVQDGPIPPVRALALLRPLADALDHAHARGVIHRDLKPANILLDAAGRPYLSDFGLAKALESASMTLDDRVLGTPRYMAPERATGPAGHRSDLYELGCVAFEMLTGQPPFRLDEPVALMHAHAHETPPRPTEVAPSLPHAVDTVFDRALAKRPTDRFASAGEFVTSLTAALADPVRPAPPGSDVPPTARRTRSRRLPWLAAGAAAVVAVVVAVVTGLVATTSAPPQAASVPTGTAAAPAPAAPSFPQPVPAPPEPAVPHGTLLYGPALDGSGTGFLDSPGEPIDPVAASIDHLPGALQMEAKTHGAYIYVQLDVDGPVRTYLADMQLAVRPGSSGEFCWSLRWAVPRELAWYWCLDTGSSRAEFRRFADGGFTTLGVPVTLPGLTTGRAVQVSLEVRPDQLVMHLDGQQVAAVTDPEVPVANTIPGLELSTKRGTGLVRITSLRMWDLPTTGGA